MSNWNPKYAGESTFKKKNHYDLKDGDVIAAILPQPKGKNAEYEGAWSKYHSVHFGYKNTEGKFRPFESPLVKNNKTKMVEVPDAALDRINQFKAALEKAKVEGNAALVAKLNILVGQKGTYNVDNNHHMNVVLLDGSIGELKIRYKAKLELDREIKRLRDEGVEPLSFEDGRLFRFSRSGTGSDTSFKVTVYTETHDVPGLGKVEKQVSHKVTPQMLARLETEGFNLDTLFQKPTAEEVREIVAESELSSGKSPACDRIFDARWKADREARKNAPQAAPAPVQEVPKAPVAPMPAVPVPAAVAPVTQAPAAVAAPKATQAQALDEMSTEDFFKMIGNPS